MHRFYKKLDREEQEAYRRHAAIIIRLISENPDTTQEAQNHIRYIREEIEHSLGHPLEETTDQIDATTILIAKNMRGWFSADINLSGEKRSDSGLLSVFANMLHIRTKNSRSSKWWLEQGTSLRQVETKQLSATINDLPSRTRITQATTIQDLKDNYTDAEGIFSLSELKKRPTRIGPKKWATITKVFQILGIIDEQHKWLV